MESKDSQQNRKKCYVTGYFFTPNAVQECPHPNVRKKFAVNGKCQVCVFVCKKCKYVQTFKFFGGIKCGYGKKTEGDVKNTEKT